MAEALRMGGNTVLSCNHAILLICFSPSGCASDAYFLDSRARLASVRLASVQFWLAYKLMGDVRSARYCLGGPAVSMITQRETEVVTHNTQCALKTRPSGIPVVILGIQVRRSRHLANRNYLSPSISSQIKALATNISGPACSLSRNAVVQIVHLTPHIR